MWPLMPGLGMPLLAPSSTPPKVKINQWREDDEESGGQISPCWYLTRHTFNVIYRYQFISNDCQRFPANFYQDCFLRCKKTYVTLTESVVSAHLKTHSREKSNKCKRCKKKHILPSQRVWYPHIWKHTAEKSQIKSKDAKVHILPSQSVVSASLLLWPSTVVFPLVRVHMFPS